MSRENSGSNNDCWLDDHNQRRQQSHLKVKEVKTVFVELNYVLPYIYLLNSSISLKKIEDIFITFFLLVVYWLFQNEAVLHF